MTHGNKALDDEVTTSRDTKKGDWPGRGRGGDGVWACLWAGGVKGMRASCQMKVLGVHCGRRSEVTPPRALAAVFSCGLGAFVDI